MNILKFGASPERAHKGHGPKFFREPAIARTSPQKNNHRHGEDSMMQPPLETSPISVYMRIEGDRTRGPYLAVVQRKSGQVFFEGDSVEEVRAKAVLHRTSGQAIP